MSVLSEIIPELVPIKQDHTVGVCINYPEEVVGYDELADRGIPMRQATNILCHKMMGAVWEWGVGLLAADDFRPFINTFLTEPHKYTIEHDNYGTTISLVIRNAHTNESTIKIFINQKPEWVY